MIGYTCKYTPVELLAALGGPGGGGGPRGRPPGPSQPGG